MIAARILSFMFLQYIIFSSLSLYLEKLNAVIDIDSDLVLKI